MRNLVLIIAVLFATPLLAQEPKTLYWTDLLPEGEFEILEQLYAEQSSPTFGHNPDDSPLNSNSNQVGTFNVVEELNGKLVRIPGFVLPFEYSNAGKISEFLLVPYFGACIHTPPPPPNQMVYVTAESPMDLGSQWQPIWAIGVLQTQSNYNDLGNAAYTLKIQKWEVYDE